MSRVRSKNTKPELVVRQWLHAKGFRYRLHDSKLPGSPDIILPKYKTLIFVNGCFWHGHEGCRYSTLPENNRSFWEKKLSDNIVRDQKQRKSLSDLGWNVITIWSCELKPKVRQETLETLVKNLKLSCVNEASKP